LESGRLHGSGEGRQVDVGGDVLPSRLPERVLPHPARPIGLERSRPALQPDVRLNVSVIDDEEIAPLQGLGCLPAPALELEADLKPVPLLETGSYLPSRVDKLPCGEGAEPLYQALPLEVHIDLPDLAMPVELQSVEREVVEHLVGQDTAHHRR